MNLLKHSLMLMMMTSLSAFAAGDKGGNGGDPADIMQQIKGSKTQIDNQVLRDEVDQYHYDIAVKKFQESKAQAARVGFVKLALVASNAYQLLSKLNYPFNFPGKAPNPQLISETLRKILGSKSDWFEDYPNVISLPRLVIHGQEVMFRSNPGQLKVEVSADRFYETLMKNNKLDSVGIIAARVATVFHEALIINGIETSRSYSYSNKFAIALIAMMTDPKFGDWAKYAMDKGNVDPQNIFSELKILKLLGFKESALIYEIKGTKNELRYHSYRPFIFSDSLKNNLDNFGVMVRSIDCKRSFNFEASTFPRIEISQANFNFPDYLAVTIDYETVYGMGRVNKDGFSIKMEDGSTIKIQPSKVRLGSYKEFDSYSVFKNDVQINNPKAICSEGYFTNSDL